MNRFLLLGLLALLFVQCTQDEDATDQTGRLTVRVTDDPFPVDLITEANVSFTKLEARRTDGVDTFPYVTLYEGEKRINLLALTNGISEELASIEVPVGTYDLLRIYVEDPEVVLTNGETYQLMIPSAAQTGIKAFINPSVEVASELSAELLLDVDLSRSFVVQGNPNTPAGINGFIFKPTLKVVNNSIAGRIAGEVRDTNAVLLEDVTISAFSADTLTTTTFTDANGAYVLAGLLPGVYKVMAEKDSFQTAEMENITVTTANRSTADFILENQ